MKRVLYTFAASMAAMVMGFSGSNVSAAVTLTGAGATFPKPLYEKWAAQYNRMNADVRINYQGGGSGAGIKQITEKTVDFGASDGPMKDEQLAKAKGEILHIPTTLGAVVPIYNLPGVDKTLVFSGPVLAEIYQGKITRWNDPKLIAINAGVNLPDKEITSVHRSDGSGTTYIFTDYLSKQSAEWEKTFGRSTTINWAGGRGAKGNDGVAAEVKQNEYSVGYVELIFAANNKIPFGDVTSASGKPVRASEASVSAAAGSIKEIPDDLRVSITAAPGDEAYPISSLTWILVYKAQEDAAKGKAVVNFLWWATHDGQAMTAPLHYAPLPKEIMGKTEARLRSITVDGKPVLE